MCVGVSVMGYALGDAKVSVIFLIIIIFGHKKKGGVLYYVLLGYMFYVSNWKENWLRYFWVIYLDGFLEQEYPFLVWITLKGGGLMS